MNLLIISNMYPSYKDPVYGTFVAAFVEQMEKLNNDGITEKVVLRGRDGNKLKKIYKYLKFYISILYALCFKRYDLIYVHTILYTILPIKWVSKWKKLPLVFNVHGSDVLTRGVLPANLKKLARPLVEQAKLVVSPSCFFKGILLREFKGLNPERIYVSPSGGVDKSFFNNFKLMHEEFTIGYVSRISEGKGWDTLLRAVKILKDEEIRCKLLVAGRGTRQKEFRKMIEDLDLTEVVNYIGPVPYSYLPNVYRQMDLFVFPTCLEESLGLVGLEAMASSVPVIGSQIGGLTDYIKEGSNGFFFMPGDVAGLVKKIKMYIGLSVEDKNQIATQAFNTATLYEAERIGRYLFERINIII